MQHDELIQLLMQLHIERNNTSHIESRKSAQIDGRLFSPHYTDDRFRRGTKTVFLASGYKLVRDGSYDHVDGLEYNYDDRIRGWDWDKAETSWQAVKTAFEHHNSAEAHEMYLRLFFDAPQLELIHIMTGVNQSNDYYYRVYGYISNKTETD
jgi:hypothetical protein